MSLLDWHRRLEGHFSDLRSVRTSKRGAGAPIFALEHGLSATEIELLQAEIRASIRTRPPAVESGLAWVVYATELGYNYCGDEYWQTFDECTRGWDAYGHPHWIRDRFKWFAETFGGARPSGPWARHFSIICWPITHAILPNDLQKQLARTLYEIRYSFSTGLLESPLDLGQRIAAASWNSSARFQKLAENALLLGHIAAALLLEGRHGSEGLLLPQTLQRIGRDLDEERRGREWLKGARRVAIDRIRFGGIENVVVGGGHPPTPVASAKETLSALGIEPTLALRPKDATRRRWGVHLDLPELSHVLLKFPGSKEALTQSRARVAGSNAGWLARGRVLQGTKVDLVRWPRPGELLLEFERPAAELSFLLRTECLLRPGPLWLFRVGSDGVAYELRGLDVRPGNQYVLLSESALRPDSFLEPIMLDCEGIHGGILEIPQALPETWARTLDALGLGHTRAFSVWPAGLPPVSWDGEGRAEWLVDDEPCVGIRSDHDCGSLALTLSSRETEFHGCLLPPMSAGTPVFVALPPLPVGVHTLLVRDDDAPSRCGQLEIAIRPPRPWTASATTRGPLLFDVDPPAPTLEALWDGELSIRLNGPVGRRVRCVVQFFERDTDAPSISKSVSPLELPVEPRDWVEHFTRQVCGNPEMVNKYDLARAATITFSGDELGVFSLRCEREPTPLRWIIKRDHSLQLLNDSGIDTPPTVLYHAFEAPDRPEPLALAQVLKGIVSHTAGGLYTAIGTDMTRSVIVRPRGHLSLSDLGTNPQLETARRSCVEEVLRVVSLASLWAKARVTGDTLSRIRRRSVLRRLCRQLFLLLGGDTWDHAEEKVGRGGSISLLEDAVRGRPLDSRLVKQMNEKIDSIVKEPCEARVRRLAAAFVDVLGLPVPMGPELRGPTGIIARNQERDNPKHPEQMTRLALWLASEPSLAEDAAGPDLATRVGGLLALPTIGRVARYVVLAVDRRLGQSAAGSRAIHAGWDWESND